MIRLAGGHNLQSVRHAVKVSALQIFITTALSLALSIIVMSVLMGVIHSVGIGLALAMPVTLGAPSIIMLNFKNLQLQQANDRLEELAATDYLTGVLNRRAFTEQVETMLSLNHGERNKGALLVIDVDRFKQINDVYGHNAGDVALQILTASLKKACGDDAHIGRIGGEEFGVFIPFANPRMAAHFGAMLQRTANAADYAPAGLEKPLTMSIGIASVFNETDFAALYTKADQKLYQAKAAGRNRVVMDGMDTAHAA